jgi:hypothetical protein
MYTKEMTKKIKTKIRSKIIALLNKVVQFRLLDSKERRIILGGIVATMVAIAGLIFLFTRTTKAAWWNDVWKYRKSIPISNGSGGNLSNFQVEVTINTATLISAGKMQNSCGDIRMINSQGEILPYWIETGTCNTSSTNIWVNIDSIPTSGTTIYIYYGNPSAAPGSNGSTTFPFFDNFDSNTLDASKWGATGSYSITNGVLTIATGSIYTKSPILSSAQGYVYEVKKSLSSTAASYSGLEIANAQSTQGSNAGSNALVYYMTSSGTLNLTSWAADGTAASYNISNGGTLYTATGGTYYIDGFSVGPSDIRFYQNRSQLSAFTGTWSAAPYLYLGYFSGSASGTSDITDISVDWVLARKYVANGPTVGTLGSEEQGTGPVAYYSFDEGHGTTIHNQMESNGEYGLIDWWKMDETSGSNLYDEMGNNNATATGTTISAGKIGNGRTLNGSSDYISSSPTTSLTGNYTVSIWVKPTSYTGGGGGNPILVSTRSGSDQSLDIQLTSTGLHGDIGTGSSWLTITADESSTPLPLNSWSHVVYTVTTSGYTIYVNGIAVASGTYSGTPLLFDSTHHIYLGTLSGTSGFLAGSLDDFRIYNRALSAGEVQAIYNTTQGAMIGFGNAGASAVWTTGAAANSNDKPLGESLTFNGTSQYVALPSGSLLDNLTNQPISFSAWIKTSGSNSYYPIISKYEYIDSTHSKGFNFYLASGGQLRMSLYPNSSPYGDLQAGPDLRDNTWHHVAAVYNGSNITLYIDGKSVGSTAYSGGFVNTTNPAYLGRLNNGSTYFQGNLDEIKIYNFALSTSQVQQQYNRGAEVAYGVGEKTSDPGMNGLVGWWKMDEGSGTTANDSSGMNNNAILINSPSWVPGKLGKGLYFTNTSSQKATVSTLDSIPIGNSNYTIEAWIKPSSYGNYGIVGWGNYGTTNQVNALRLSSTGITNYWWSNDLNATVPNLTDGKWHHVVAEFDGTTRSIYVDDNLVASDSPGSSHNVTNANFTFGDTNTSEYFNGGIDNLKIWNRALSAGEIAYEYSQSGPLVYYKFDEGYGHTIHSETESTLPSPVNYWKFDEGTGSTTADEMARNNGTISGASWDTAARTGYDLSFNGSTSYVSTGNLAFSSLPFSFTGWIYLPATPTTYYTIFLTDDFTTNYYGIWAQVDSNSAFWINYGDSNTSGPTARRSKTSPNNAIPIGSWVHVAAVIRGPTDMSLYVNGVDVGGTYSGTGGALAVNSNTGYIGRGGNNSTYFNGKIDELKLYSKALTSTDIRNDYTSFAGASLKNPTWVNGAQPSSNQKPLGKALYFNNTTGQYVDIGDRSEFEVNNFSISAWVYRLGNCGAFNNCYIMSKGGSGYKGWGLDIILDNGSYKPQLRINDDLNKFTGNTVINTGTWYHIVGVADTSTIYIYVNGNLDSSFNRGGAIPSYSTAHVKIGNGNDNSDLPMNGYIDEVKFFNYAISANDVKTEYNRGAATVLGVGMNNSDTAGSNLQVWYKMDEKNLGNSLAVTTGDGSDGALNVTSGTTTLDTNSRPNGYNYTTINISSGATLTASGSNPLILRATGSITISGTVSVNGGNGTSGNGDIVTLAGGTGIAGGANGGCGGAYDSNGCNGNGTGAGYGGLYGDGTGGGGGGGGGYGTAGGAGGNNASNPSQNLGGAGGTTYYGDDTGSGPAPTGGSGGGGGAGTRFTHTRSNGGSGGAGGGVLLISAPTVTINSGGSIQSNGGNGGSAYQDYDAAGGGGSGGSIKISANRIVNSGSITTNGGSPGSSGPNGGAGGQGGQGRIYIATNSLEGSGSISGVTSKQIYNSPFSLMDSSGNNYTGLSQYYPSPTPGKIGGGLYFDGSNTYVSAYSIPDSVFSGYFTISTWVKFSSVNKGTDNAIAGHGSASTNNGLHIGERNGKAYFGFYSNDLAGNQVLTPNTWYHLTFVYDGGKKIYINGLLDASGASGAYTGTGSNFEIGRYPWSTTQHLYGTLDNFKIWNKALSPSEIEYEYNQGGPVYYWRFDDGSGNLARNDASRSVSTQGLVGFWPMDQNPPIDVSGNGNNLTTIGSPTVVTGYKGNAIDYAASSNQYSYCTDASCGADLDYQGYGLTISAWVYMDSAIGTSARSIVNKSYWNSTTDNGGYSLAISPNTGYTQFFLTNSSGTANYIGIYSNTALSTGAWHYIAGVYDPVGGQAYLYIDGSLAASSAYSGGVKNVTQNFEIGNDPATNSTPWDGKIDHVKIWQRTLSYSEIQLEYSSNENYGYLINFPNNNSQWVAGRFGKSLAFDGSSQYVIAYDSGYQKLTGPLTLEAWVNPSNLSASNPEIIANSLSSYGFRMRFLSGGKVRFNAYGTSDDTLDSNSTIPANQWSHIVMTYDGSYKKIYINGNLDAQEPTTGSLNTGDPDVTIGANKGAEYFPGKIDEVKIYNYALSASQVRTAYNHGSAVLWNQ